MLYSIPAAVVLPPLAPIMFALGVIFFSCVIVYGVIKYNRGE